MVQIPHHRLIIVFKLGVLISAALFFINVYLPMDNLRATAPSTRINPLISEHDNSVCAAYPLTKSRPANLDDECVPAWDAVDSKVHSIATGICCATTWVWVPSCMTRTHIMADLVCQSGTADTRHIQPVEAKARWIGIVGSILVA